MATGITTINYSSGAAFSFDASKLEFVDSKVQLKKIVYANETGYFMFLNDGNLNPDRGIYPITLPNYDGSNPNTATVSGGKLNFVGSNKSKAVLDRNVFGAGIGTIHFKFKPNFSVLPGTMQLFTWHDTTGTDKSKIQVYLVVSGLDTNITVAVQNNTGGNLFAGTMHTVTLAAGTEYDFLFSFDPVTGNTRFFWEGIERYSKTLLSTFNSTVNHVLYIGQSEPPQSADADYSIDDLLLYDIATKNDNTPFTVPFVSSPTYPTDPAVESTTPLAMADIVEMDGIENKSGSDEIKYQFKFIGIYYYVSAGALAVSDGTYAQSSSLAEIKAALDSAALDVSPDSPVYIVALLHSGNGFTTPELTSVTFEYNYYFDSSSLSFCIITGTVIDHAGAPVVGAEVILDTKKDYFYGEHLVAKKIKVLTDSEGKYYAKAVETVSTGLTVTATISYVDTDGKTITNEYKNLIVPNQLEETLAEMVAASLVA